MANFLFNDSNETSTQDETPITDVSYIGPDVEMEGAFLMHQPLEIAGSINGTISSNNLIKVCESGHLQGEVEANTIEVHGQAEGEFTARKRLEIGSGGCFIGSLVAQPEVIVLSEHAKFGKDVESAEQFYQEYVSTRKKVKEVP